MEKQPITVAELIDALKPYDSHRLVYIASDSEMNSICPILELVEVESTFKPDNDTLVLVPNEEEKTETLFEDSDCIYNHDHNAQPEQCEYHD
jgi:hypothetical protein